MIPQNKQEYLDLLIKTSKDGKFPSTDGNGNCRYRDVNGNKCAFGLLIEDKDYQSEFENIGVSSLLDRNPHLIQNWFNCSDNNNPYIKFSELRKVQIVHDELSYNWNHEEFVELLLNCKMFKGMKPNV